MPVDTLFLDAGGVLVHPNWERVSAALSQRGVSVPAAVLAAAEPHAKRELDDPQQIVATRDADRWSLYFKLVFSHARVAPTAPVLDALEELQRYHARCNLWESVPAEVPSVLARLRALGLRLVVVSNSNGTLRDQLARLGLAPLFDHVLDSCELGVEKPDPRIFRIALERAAARPETTVHVGDLYHVDVVGARAAAVRAVLLDAAWLYDGVDCERVRSLSELANGLQG